MPFLFTNRPLVVTVVVLLLMGPVRNLEPATGGDESYIKRWTEIRQLIASEREGWRERKELLTYTIELLKSEIGNLNDQIAETEELAKEVEREQGLLRVEESSHRTAADSVETKISEYENKLLSLKERFPTPLIERIRKFTVQIPDSSEESDLSLAQRIVNVLRILGEVDKFNSNVTVLRELLKVDSGKVVEVKTLYLGLSQGYYVDPSAKYAAVGRPQLDGWKWDSKNDIAKEVSVAIAMQEKKKTPAEFIELPVSID